MGKLSGEFREPNRKDKVTRCPSVSYTRYLGLLVNTLGGHLKFSLLQPALRAAHVNVYVTIFAYLTVMFCLETE